MYRKSKFQIYVLPGIIPYFIMSDIFKIFFEKTSNSLKKFALVSLVVSSKVMCFVI